MEKKIKVSVITVCFNAEKDIEETIRSVQNQTYSNIEYIIKDGDSKDRTLELVEKAAKNSEIKIYSEKDKGIYDAMNYAALKSSGDYLFFLNAGDLFHNKRVVEKFVGEANNHPDAEILFGNTVFVDGKGYKTTRKYTSICSKKMYFLLGDCICHQVIFTKRNYFFKRIFSTDYKICADREWLLNSVCNNARFYRINDYISICKTDGFSAQNMNDYEREVKQCIKSYFSSGYYVYLLIYKLKQNDLIRFLLKKIGKILF